MIQDPETTIQISMLEARIQANIDHQRNIQRAKDYYNGKQTVFLTNRMREYLNLPNRSRDTKAAVQSYLGANNINRNTVVDDFHLNIVQTIVMAVLDELSVNGFDTSEKAKTDGTKEQSAWARRVWDANKMSTRQHEVHLGALRDHESFVMVDYDHDDMDDDEMDKDIPRLTYHEYYIDQDAGGDGDGVLLVRENDNPDGEVICAVKEWTCKEDGKTMRRRNVYYDDRVEKYYRDPDWKPYFDEEAPDVWPIPWIDAKGKPLGVPVISFRNFGGVPEAWEALNVQDAINKVMLDVLAEADGAFRMFFMSGTYGTSDGQPPKSDGSNAISVSPMSIIGMGNNPDAKVIPVEGGDPTKLMASLKDIILIAAQITGTPVSYFVTTKQIAGADTLKGQDKPLTKKVEKRKDIFGQSWADVMTMARRVANTFGGAGLDESISFYTNWKMVFDLETIAMMRTTLGLPYETLWRIYGMSEEQIQATKETDEYKAGRVLLDKVFWDGWAVQFEKGSSTFAQYASANGWSDEQIAAFEAAQTAQAKANKTAVGL